MKYRDCKFVFDKNKKLNKEQESQLLELAEIYLKYLNVIDFNKQCEVDSKFEIDNYTIKVDVIKKILGLKKVKTYYFILDENKVIYVPRGKNPNIRISDDNSTMVISFLEFVSRQCSNLEDLGITLEEREYGILPVSIS